MAQTTPNYGLNIAEGTDTVNLLTQCYPNFSSLDSIIKGIADTGVTTASETKSGTVHQLVRSNTDCNIFRFTATSNFTTGDSFTVDGTPVTGVTVSGAGLQTGDFVINSNVLAIVNGGILTLFAGGAISTLAAQDVTYDNTGSGLSATDVQDAIDEIVSDIPTGFAATAISYDNSGSGLTATNAQDAIDEIAAALPSSGSVSVTNDGTLTAGQMLNNLFALVDLTKINDRSVLKLNTVVLPMTINEGNSFTFNSTNINIASSNLVNFTAKLSSASTYARSITATNNTTFNNFTNTVQGAGEVYALYY